MFIARRRAWLRADYFGPRPRARPRGHLQLLKLLACYRDGPLRHSVERAGPRLAAAAGAARRRCRVPGPAWPGRIATWITDFWLWAWAIALPGGQPECCASHCATETLQLEDPAAQRLPEGCLPMAVPPRPAGEPERAPAAWPVSRTGRHRDPVVQFKPITDWMIY